MKKMHDLGYTHNNNECEPALVSSDKKKKHYPSVWIDREVPDALMDKNVGDLIRCEVVLKITSKELQTNDNGQRKSMRLEFHKIGVLGKAGSKTKEEYLSMSKEDRAKYDEEQLDG